MHGKAAQKMGASPRYRRAMPGRGPCFASPFKVSKEPRAGDQRESAKSTSTYISLDSLLWLVASLLWDLVEHLGPKRGAKLWDRFEIHYAPKHDSWLNQAEIEISMFSRGCLGKDRIATVATLTKRAAAWTRRMNDERRTINWRFTRAKARAKFRYLPFKSSDGQH